MTLKWFYRILLIILAICIFGMATVAIVKSRQALREGDALIARADYLLEKYGGR